MPRELLTGQVARYLRVSESRVYQLRAAGLLTAKRLRNGRLVFRAEDVRRLAEPAPAAPAPPPEPPAGG
jgi:hypothetical protein